MKNLLTFISLSLILLLCKEITSDQQIESNLKSKILSGDKELVMSELTNFKWDSLLILTPYSRPDKIEDQFHVDLSSVKHSEIEHSDSFNQLIFLYQGKVVNMVEHDRYPGDFSKNEIEMIARSKAAFSINLTEEKTTDGKQWIEIIREK